MFTQVCVNSAALFDVLFQGHGEMILFKLFSYFKVALIVWLEIAKKNK